MAHADIPMGGSLPILRGRKAGAALDAAEARWSARRFVVASVGVSAGFWGLILWGLKASMA